MTNISIEDAQANLLSLIHNLAPGDEVAITENNRMVAKLVAATVEHAQPVAGRGKHTLIVVSEDSEHLEDFKEYMP